MILGVPVLMDSRVNAFLICESLQKRGLPLYEKVGSRETRVRDYKKKIHAQLS